MKIKVITLICFFSFFMLEGASAADKKKVKEVSSISCKYIVRSLIKPTIAGVDLSKRINFAVVSEVGAIFAGNTSNVPLDFTIQMDIVNDNPFKIQLTGMEYILRVDNVELTRGNVTKKVSIGIGKTKPVPIPVHMDLSKLVRGSSGTALQNMVRNFMNQGTKPSRVMLQIKPTYRVGKEDYTSPHYIPLSFTFGGK